MAASIFDSSVLVLLAQRDDFDALTLADEPRYVPSEVDEEWKKGATKHPEHYARYTAALARGLFEVREMAVGSAEYAEFLRLRAARTSPLRNRGEDACVALARTMPGSTIYVDDKGAAARAKDDLGDACRVMSSADLLGRRGRGGPSGSALPGPH